VITTEDLVRAVDRATDDASGGVGAHVELLRHHREGISYYLGDVITAVPVPLARPSLISHSLVFQFLAHYWGNVIAAVPELWHAPKGIRESREGMAQHLCRLRLNHQPHSEQPKPSKDDR